MRNILRIGCLTLICLVCLLATIGGFLQGDNLFGAIFLVVALAIIIWFIWKYIKRREFNQEIEEEYQRMKRVTSGIDKHINDALITIDSIATCYDGEEEANKELILSLKSKGLDATYQFRLHEGTIADGIVGDFLIEGKLEPGKSEIDRLIGQLETYSRYPYKVIVVIYGRINKDQLERISEHIDKHYPDRVFLSYLDNPHRCGRTGSDPFKNI